MNEKQEQIQGEIFALKSLLEDTDYQCLKYAEGALTEAEFADTRAKRRAWREKVNELEEELKGMESDEVENDLYG
jgi:hypothetical protein